MLSRAKPAVSTNASRQSAEKQRKLPELSAFIEKRDYTGALTLIEVL